MVKNLRKLRTERKVSQQQLADVIGTSQQSINKYENHNVEPDISTLIKLSDYFHTTVDYLVGHVFCPMEEDLSEELELSKEELSLVRDFRKLSKEEQDSIYLILRNYLKVK